MKENFAAALAAVLVHEGGFVDDPRDPGGRTNHGVTQSVYDVWRVDHGQSTRDVKLISGCEVEGIYRRRYWDVISGDELPAGVDYSVFDFAVNSGVKRAARFLQRIVGVVDDGQIGPVTIAAVKARNPVEIIAGMSNLRLGFLEALPTFARFGGGWTRRVSEVRSCAMGMCA